MFALFAKITFTSAWIIVTATFAVITFCSLAGFLSGQDEFCELLSHLRLAYCLVLLLICIAFIGLKARKLGTFAAFILILNLIPVLSLYLPPNYSETSSGPDQNTVSEQQTIKLLEMNLWGGKNKNHSAVLSLIDDTAPDIIGFSEVTASWLSVLQDKLKSYHYQIAQPLYGGIAVFSRIPFETAEVRYSGPRHRPRIVARLRLKNQNITLIFSHPLIPIHTFALRNAEFTEITTEARTAKEPVLLAGDLNCTPWSVYFDKLKREGNLIDSEQGFGPQPSWNVITPLLPIDHLLTSSDFVTTKRRICPPIGSDHFAVYAEVRLRSVAKKSDTSAANREQR
jgi:endonuclease/exonuclease/phosphatase (EEP) superfamily protein YafD